MELLKKLFKDEDRAIGLCSFRKQEEEPVRVFIPEFNPSKTIYGANYGNNFFLL